MVINTDTANPIADIKAQFEHVKSLGCKYTKPTCYIDIRLVPQLLSKSKCKDLAEVERKYEEIYGEPIKIIPQEFIHFN